MILLQFFEGAKIEYYLRINNLNGINHSMVFILIFKKLGVLTGFADQYLFFNHFQISV